MTGSLAGLLAANGLYLAIGAGLLPLLGAARSWSALLVRLPVAYMLGVAVVGILAAHLALLDLELALPDLAALASLLLMLGGRRILRRGAPSSWRLPAPRPAWIVAAGSAAAATLLLAHGARTFAVRPLLEWDGWASWGMKARALYEVGGGLDSPALTSQFQLPYPLLLPSLEAIAFRAMGAFDGTLVHVQLIALAFGFAAALWGLLAGRVPAEILGPAIVALAAATPLLAQLSTNYADIPLAFFVALGVVALARWVVEDEGWLLALASVFLGAAVLTKNEGAIFAVVAFAALVVGVAPRWRRLGRPALALLGLVAIVAPWRIFLAVNGLRDVPEGAGRVDLGYLSDRTERVGPAARRLWEESVSADWGYLLPLLAAGLLASVLAGRFALAAYAVLWMGLSFFGLVLVYWSSSEPLDDYLLFTADRSVVSLVIGGAALAPLLAGEAWRLVLERRTLPAAGRALPAAQPGRMATADLVERS